MLLGYMGLATAASGEPPPAEEIVVYGDAYARFHETRFQIHSEGELPMGLLLDDGRGEPFTATRWSTDLLLYCRKGEPQLWDGIEVACQIEDISVRAATDDPIRRERERERIARILSRIDAMLTDAVVQMQVSAHGTVPNLDLEAIPAATLRERRARESMRQLLSLSVSGLSLRLPGETSGLAHANFIERNSALMDLPSATASRGSSALVHEMSTHGEHRRILSAGEGSTALTLDGSLLHETIFSMTARSEALLRISDGIMTERRWQVEGVPSPSSPIREPCRMLGHLRIIEGAALPDLGATGLLEPSPTRSE